MKRLPIKIYSFCLLFAVVFNFLTLFSVSISVYSLQPTTVSVSPSSVTASIGQNFNINVTISSVSDLYGWEFKLSWNASLLNSVNVIEGPFLKAGGSTFFTYKTNATAGYVVVDCTLLGDISGVGGGGALATITFYVKTAGECPLDLYEVTLLNSLEQPIPCEVVDGYGHFIHSHDVAVTSVSASPITVFPSDIVNINVTVQNQGGFIEDFNVTTCYNSKVIETQSVSLDIGALSILTFAWNTKSVGKGDYAISANASVVSGETDTADNIKVADCIVTVLSLGHDVAIKNVTPSKTVVAEGCSLFIRVTAKNYGNFTETLNITAYYDSKVINNATLTLTSGDSVLVMLPWDTTDIAKGNYIISASVTSVPNETDTTDNTFIDGIVEVLWKGDVNKDNVVDGQDIVLIIGAIPSYPGHPKWNPYADINGDDLIDGQDAVICIGLIPKEYV